MKKAPFVVLFTFLFLLQCIFTPAGNQLYVYAAEDILDTEAPSPPSNLILSSCTDTTATFSWTGSNDDIGVAEYDVYRDSVKIGTTNDLLFTDENLSSENTYTFFLIAKDVAGNQSEPSDSLTVLTGSGSNDSQAPGVPSDLTVTGKSDTTISIRWNESTDDIGVTGYDIYDSNIVAAENVTGAAFTISGLRPGETHNISAKARDAAGNVSGSSNILSVSTLLSAPYITVSAKTTRIIISWEPLAEAVGYEIEADGVLSSTGINCSYTHEGLLSNTPHVYKVRGIDVNGEAGIWSQEINAVTGVLPVPGNIHTSQTFTSINISWYPVEETEEYELEADGILISNMLETSYTQSGLLVNTNHTYRVRAKNSGGHSEWSELKNVRTTSYGTGTPDDPFIIIDKSRLLDMKNNLSASYKLGADIDLERAIWEPVGSSAAPFTGTFDGNGYTVSNFTINKPTVDNVGFFGYTNNAAVSNLILSNINVTGKQFTGGLVGQTAGTSTIQNCSIKGASTINGTANAGGLIGRAIGTVDRCSSEANVTLTGTGSNCGGLIGVCEANVSKSYSTGDVTSGGPYVGGLLGTVSISNINVTESYSTGNASGSDRVGGLVGNISGTGAIVSNCFAMGSVTAPADKNAGGLVGYFSTGTVRYCYSTGAINSSGSYTGGLIGRDSGTITGCYYDGIASGYIPKKASDTSKLTSGMKSQATFSGWDFSSVWTIDEGTSYPYLINTLKPLGVSEGLPTGDVGSGNGTVTNPYIITSKEQLSNEKYDLIGNYILGADIALQNTSWEPVGSSTAPFTGTFDGNGYTVSDFTINKPTVDNVGFWGYTNNAAVSNLILSNINVTGKQFTGGLVGQTAGTSTIQNCSIKGASTINGTANAGGLIGRAIGTVDRCSSEANVTLTGTGSNCGGLIGVCEANVSKSYSTGDVTSGGPYVGGLLGTVSISNINVTESYSTGNASGSDRVGGLVGNISGTGAIVSNCFAMGSVTAPADKNAGGLVGYFSTGTVRYCYSTGAINSSGSYAGGLIGRSSGTVTSSYFDSTTTGKTTPAAQAKTTIQLRAKATYSSWDFTSIWNISEGVNYPELRNTSATTYIPVPTCLNLISVTDNSIEISWQNTLEALSYDVEVDGSTVNVGLNTRYIHSNLSPGTNHTYRIRQNTSSGQSNWSHALSFYTKLPVPHNIKVTPDITSIVLSWDDVSETQYELEIDGAIINNGSLTTYLHSDLIPGTEHKYRIRSKNFNIVSAWSELIIVFTLSENYPYPKNLRAMPDETSVLVKWDAGEGAISYELSADGLSVNTTETLFMHIGLLQSTQHYYKIRAVYAEGTSVWSPMITVTTLSDMPGSGTATDPYIIKTVNTLKKVKNNLAAYYKLANNIDLQNEEWVPIGTSSAPFVGTFDGDGYTINNLRVTQSTSSNIGFFGYISKAVIKNIKLNNVSVTGRQYIGGLIGYSANQNTIQNCSITGAVSGASFIGGLIGMGSNDNDVTGCSSLVSINGTGDSVGGLIGSTGGDIHKSYATGSVTSTGGSVGGLVGSYNSLGYIAECYATGNVTGTSYVGGLIGNDTGIALEPIPIKDSYALGNVKATKTSAPYVGGLIGYVKGYSSSANIRMINCYSAGTITGGTTYTGGLVGASSNSAITSCYFDSSVTGFTTPTTQSRTTEQLMQQATFIGWDLTSIWKIDEGTSYPYLRLLQAPISFNVININENSVSLSWRPVANTTGYDIEVDGTITDNGLNTTYIHNGLQPGTEHTYRVRSKTSSQTSPWSNTLTVITIFPGQIALTLTVSETSITATWNGVPGAVSYDIEVDGNIINNGLLTSYTHNLTTPNVQHTYRVRARTQKAATVWSNIAQGINWSQSLPGICLAETNWVSGSGQDVEVVIKANNIPDMYTSYFVLQFDPQALEPDPQSITNLVWPGGSDAYIKYAVYWETGRIKIIVSKKGTTSGITGQFDTIMLKFRTKTVNTSQLLINPAQLVDSSGKYIGIPGVQPLIIKLISN